MKRMLVVVLFLTSTILYPQWMKIEVDNSQLGAGGAIDAYDSLNVILSYNKNLYISKDGGENWISFSLPNNSSAIDIAMINPNTIVLAMDDGSILRTSDGGDNWNEVWYNPELSTFMNYVEYFEDNNLIAMGDGNLNNSNAIDRPLILYSDDEGISLTQIPVTEQIGAYSGDTWRRIDFVTPNIGYFRSSASMFENTQGLYKTGDGGYSWTKLEKEAGFALIKFYNENIGLAADQYKVYLTKDGGLTWQISENEFNAWPNDFEFIPESPHQVWYVNLDGLFYSNDMGMNWTEYKTEDNPLRARDIVFTDNKNGFILCDYGRIFYTNNNGGITVSLDEEPKTEVVNNYNLEQNYPNPFNPSTTINYQIPTDGKVTLKVYDVLGKEVSTLVDEEKRAGRYKVYFNSITTDNNKTLASGIYFAKIVSGEFSKTIKLLLMK